MHFGQEVPSKIADSFSRSFLPACFFRRKTPPSPPIEIRKKSTPKTKLRVPQKGRSKRGCFGNEKGDDHDQDFLSKDVLHICPWSSLCKSAHEEEENDDHDQYSLEKDLVRIWSWSSDFDFPFHVCKCKRTRTNADKRRKLICDPRVEARGVEHFVGGIRENGASYQKGKNAINLSNLGKFCQI